MRFKILFLVVGVAFLAMMAYFAPGSFGGLFEETSEAPERLIFGAVLPLSGANERSGRAAEAGLRIAEGTLLSLSSVQVPVEVRVADSRFSPDEGARGARELIDGGASALYSSFTYVTSAVNTVSIEHSTTLFYDSCNCGFAEDNEHAFQIYVDPRAECARAAENLVARGGTRAVFAGPNVDYASYCIDALGGVLGAGNVQAVFDSMDTIPNHTVLLQEFFAGTPGLVVSLPISMHAARIIEASGEVGARFACFSAQCETPEIVEQLSPFAHAALDPFDFVIREDFVERVAATLDTPPEALSRNEIVSAAVAHDALVYAATAHVRCGSASAACVETHAERTLIPLAIASNGFDEARILKYTTE